ncbi:MAG: hypothetical protein U0941_30405 [Planctomycetaceae bacterium]
MNDFELTSSSQIERLVDGELPREERRAVLMALDHEPDGWRRLAMAFLESQSIRESLSCRSQVTSAVANPIASQVVRPDIRSPSRSSAIVATVAAALMFGLGRLSSPGTRLLVQELPQKSIPATYHQPSATSPDESSSPPMLASDSTALAQRQQTLRLELDDDYGGPSQVVEVPMLENANIRPEELLDGPPVISDTVQRALLRSGKRVREHRQLYEVTLEDGRRGLMPVSNVFLENADWDVYQ